MGYTEVARLLRQLARWNEGYGTSRCSELVESGKTQEQGHVTVLD